MNTSLTAELAALKKRIEECVAAQLVYRQDDAQLEHTLREMVADYLSLFDSKRIVQQSRVDGVTTRWVSWTELYPKLTDRVLAYVAARVLKLPRHCWTQHWYHTVFPYRICYQPLIDSITEESIPQYEAALAVAHKATTVNVSLMAVQPVESSKVVVARPGEDFDGCQSGT